jgi:hypothetical protein
LAPLVALWRFRGASAAESGPGPATTPALAPGTAEAVA